MPVNLMEDLNEELAQEWARGPYCALHRLAKSLERFAWVGFPWSLRKVCISDLTKQGWFRDLPNLVGMLTLIRQMHRVEDL